MERKRLIVRFLSKVEEARCPECLMPWDWWWNRCTTAQCNEPSEIAKGIKRSDEFHWHRTKAQRRQERLGILPTTEQHAQIQAREASKKKALQVYEDRMKGLDFQQERAGKWIVAFANMELAQLNSDQWLTLRYRIARYANIGAAQGHAWRSMNASMPSSKETAQPPIETLIDSSLPTRPIIATIQLQHRKDLRAVLTGTLQPPSLPGRLSLVKSVILNGKDAPETYFPSTGWVETFSIDQSVLDDPIKRSGIARSACSQLKIPA
jgi:hypothetical protein